MKPSASASFASTSFASVNTSACISHCRPLLEKKKVLLGITGSIAAYKACELVRILKKCGAETRAVLSDGAKNFVAAAALETLSGAPVLDSMWRTSAAAEDGCAPIALGTHHISAARWADIALIAPATAHAIAKLANGLCDDLLSTEMLAFTGPLFIAPAMNPAMWDAAATRENVEKLRKRGVFFLGPDAGPTACGEEGPGRMVEPEDLVSRLALQQARPSALSVKRPRVLITLGPTRSYADPVRFLSNRSSGKMGAALAWAAVASGCEVTCVAGPTEAVLPPLRCGAVGVETAAEMHAAASELWGRHDIFIGAAAVLDWEFSETMSGKIKKSEKGFSPAFKQSVDILASVAGSARPDQFVLGFAAESADLERFAARKLREKNCDAVFANDISRGDAGFEADFNGGLWLDRAAASEIPLTSKTLLAHRLISRCLQGWKSKNASLFPEMPA